MAKSKKPRFQNLYKTENELCDLFIAYAKEHGWKVYPETSGWDMILVKDIQMGIQAKLKDNTDVLAQAIEGLIFNPKIKWENSGPHVRAVLVPRASQEFNKIARALNVFVIEAMNLHYDWKTRKYTWIKEIKTDIDMLYSHYKTSPRELCWIPDVEINVPAGVKSPKLVTAWKIKAIALCFKLRENGYLTSRDFKEANLSMTLWKRKWLIDSGTKEKTLTKYISKPNILLPDELYPEIAEALKVKK